MFYKKYWRVNGGLYIFKTFIGKLKIFSVQDLVIVIYNEQVNS